MSGTRASLARAGLLLVIACSVLATAGARAQESDLVLRLKVAYLFNFTRFVQWPDRSADRPFVIAVMGDSALAEALRVLEREGRRVEGAPIRIRPVRGLEELGDPCILVVGAGALDRLPSILKALAGRPVLLVGDSPGLARRGVAVNFFLKRDPLSPKERLRFEIAPAALDGRGLKVSSQLYDVAEIVR